MESLRGRRQRMRLRVLETEYEIHVRLGDHGFERGGDVLGSRFMLAMDQPELPLGLLARSIEDSLAVGCEGPVFLRFEAFVSRYRAHVLARGEADAAQQWIGTEHL